MGVDSESVVVNLKHFETLEVDSETMVVIFLKHFETVGVDSETVE